MKPTMILASRQGTAAIEFALMAPILALLTTAGYDFSRALYEQHRLTAAARAGEQYAIQSSSTWTDSTDITTAVRNDANDTTDALTVSVAECTCPTGSGACATTSVCTGSTVAGTYVSVKVSESYTTLVKYPFVTSPFTISAPVYFRVK